MKERINVIVKYPHKPARMFTIPDELWVYQELVGGYIETVATDELVDALLIVNEEGRLLGLEENVLGLVGTVLLVGVDDEDFADAPITPEEFDRRFK